MRGLNKIPLAVNHPWIQVGLTFGGGIALVLFALWLRDSVWSRLPIWVGPATAAFLIFALFAEGAYEEWHKSDTTASTLKKRLIPSLWVAWDTSYRASKDSKHKWIILQVHNGGDTVARNVYVKVIAVNVVFSAAPVPLVPAHGTRLKWNSGQDAMMNIAGQSREDLQIGIHYADFPDNWYLTTIAPEPTTFPLSPGVYDVALEVCADNATKVFGSLRITYQKTGDFRLDYTPVVPATSPSPATTAQ